LMISHIILNWCAKINNILNVIMNHKKKSGDCRIFLMKFQSDGLAWL
jgi:hypothetical protein